MYIILYMLSCVYCLVYVVLYMSSCIYYLIYVIFCILSCVCHFIYAVEYVALFKKKIIKYNLINI